MEDKKINRPKSPSQKVKKSFLGTSRAKLLFALMFSFVVAMASGVAIVFGVKNQKGLDNSNRVQITRYENELPLEIVDGEIRSYNGVNNGGAVLEIPSQVYITNDGKVFVSEEKYNQYLLELEQQKIDNENNQNNDIDQNENQSIDQNIDNQNDINTNQDDENIQVKNTQSIQGGGYVELTSIAQGAFKDVKFFCLTIDMENIARVGQSAFENAENIYLVNNQNGYVIADYAFKNSTMLLEDGILYAKPNGSNASIGNEAFLGVKAFDYDLAKSQTNNQIALKAAATQTSNATLVASETSGIIKLGSSSIGGISNIDFTNFYGTVYFADQMAASNTTLRYVTLPKGATYIGDNVFNACNNLESVTSQGDIVQLGWGAFAKCPLLTSINLRFTSLKEIKMYTFQYCNGLSNIQLPIRTQTIGRGAFMETAISSIDLSKSVTTIGDYAFNTCPNLTSVAFSNSLTTIGEKAFDGCALSNLTLPASLTSLDKTAFGLQNMDYVVANSSSVYNLIASGVPFVAETYRVLASADNGTNSYLSSGFTKTTDGSYNVYTAKNNGIYLQDNNIFDFDAFVATDTLHNIVVTSYNTITLTPTYEDYYSATYNGSGCYRIANSGSNTYYFSWTQNYYTEGVRNYIFGLNSGFTHTTLTSSEIYLGEYDGGYTYYLTLTTNEPYVAFRVGVLKSTLDTDGYSSLTMWNFKAEKSSTLTINTKSVDVGSTYGNLPTPTRSGYTFAGWNLLPQGYTAVEYIQSSGTQYIDTGISYNQNLSFEIDFSDFTSIGHRAVFGDNGTVFTLVRMNDQNTLRFCSGVNSMFNYTSFSSNERYFIKVSKNYMVVNDTSLSSEYDTDNSNGGTYKLFGGSLWSYSSFKLYSFKIFNNGTLVRNFIPCMNPSGEYGLWDTVTNQFFANAGSGSFIGGPAKDTTITSASFVELTGSHKLYAHWGNNLVSLNPNKPGVNENLIKISYYDFVDSTFKYENGNAVINFDTTITKPNNRFNNVKIQAYENTYYRGYIGGWPVEYVGQTVSRSFTYGTIGETSYNRVLLMVNGTGSYGYDLAFLIEPINGWKNGQVYTLSFYYDSLSLDSPKATISRIKLEEGSSATEYTPIYAVETGSEYGYTQTPTREGYSFAGWYENNVTNITQGGTNTTVTNGIVSTNGIDIDTYFYVYVNGGVVTGERYKIIFQASVSENNIWGFYWNGDWSQKISVVNGYNEIIYTAKSGSSNLQFDDYLRSDYQKQLVISNIVVLRIDESPKKYSTEVTQNANYSLYADWIPNSGANSQYGYKVVDYLQSTGTQYINTGVAYNDNQSFDIEFSDFVSSGTNLGIFAPSDAPRFSLVKREEGQIAWYNKQDNMFLYESFSSSARYHITCSLNSFTLNGTSYPEVSDSGNVTGTGNYLIFKYRATNPTAFKLYSFKIWDNGTLIRNFLPVWSEENQAYGLYDTVNNKFYGNDSGTGAFVGGPELYEY